MTQNAWTWKHHAKPKNKKPVTKTSMTPCIWNIQNMYIYKDREEISVVRGGVDTGIGSDI